MSETREKAKQLLQQLNKLLKLDIKNAEVTGASTEELPSLVKLYQSYLSVINELQAVLPQPIHTADFEAAASAIGRHRDVMADSPQLKSFQMFNDCLHRLDRYERLFSNCVLLRDAGANWATFLLFDDDVFHGAVRDTLTAVCGAEALPTTPLNVQHVQRLTEQNAEGTDKVVKNAAALFELGRYNKEVEKALDVQITVSKTSELDLTAVVAVQSSLAACTVQLESLVQTCTSDRRADNLPEVAEATMLLSIISQALAFLQTWEALQKDTASITDLISTPTIRKSLEPFQGNVASAAAALSGVSRAAVQDRVSLLSFAKDDQWIANLRTGVKHIERVRAGVAKIIDTARVQFPRMTAFEDKELLHIVGSTDARRIETCDPYLKHLFPGWRQLLVEEGATNRIIGIVAESGETFMLDTPIEAVGPLPDWIATLQDNVEATLRRHAKAAHETAQLIAMGVAEVENELFAGAPLQIAVLGLHFLYTALVESMIAKDTTRDAPVTEASPAGPVDHFGSRPTSAASVKARPTSAVSRLTALTRPTLSPSAPKDRPTSGGQVPSAAKKSTLSRAGKSEKKEEVVLRPAAVHGRNTPGLADAAEEAAASKAPSSTEVDPSPRRHSVRDRHMTAASRPKLQRVFNQIMTTLHRSLHRASSSYERHRATALLATQFRLREAWEQHLSQLKDSSDTLWLREPRAYSVGDRVRVEVGLLSVPYGWEYIGDVTPFVLTPSHHELWERVCVSLETHRGALVVGPSSTGKLAAVRALAQLCGRRVTCLDCDAKTTVESALAFVRSASASGAWAVAIHVEQASQATQVALARYSAAALGSTSRGIYYLDSADIKLHCSPGYALFAVTSDVTSVHEDIRRTYRCCHLPPVDAHFLNQGCLVSHGFREAATLSTRLKALFSAVQPLVTATPLLRITGPASNWGLAAHAGALRATMAAATEDHVLIRALDDFWVPRFAESDAATVERFMRPLRARGAVSVDFFSVRSEVEQVLSSKHLKPTPCVVSRVVTLHRWAIAENLAIKTPIFISGPPSSGKSTLVEVTALVAARVHDKPQPQIVSIDPRVPSLVASSLNARRATAASPVWATVNMPTADVLKELLAAVRYAEHVTVFVETIDDSVFDDKLLPMCRLLSTSAAFASDSVSLALDAAAAAEPHVWTSAVVHDIAALFNKHLVHIRAASSRDLSVFTTVRTMVAFLTGTFQSVPQRTSQTTETAFWLAASWTCALPGDAAWDALVAQWSSPELELKAASSVYLLADGNVAPWTDLTAQQFSADELPLFYTAAIARAIYLASILLQRFEAVAFVGAPSLGKSLAARRLAADRGYKTAVLQSQQSISDAVRHLPDKEKALLIVDNDASLTATDIAAIRDFAGCDAATLRPKGAKMIFAARELPAELREVVPRIDIVQVADAVFATRVAKDARLDASVVFALSKIASTCAANGAPLSPHDIVNCAQVFAQSDKLLLPAEIASLATSALRTGCVSDDSVLANALALDAEQSPTSAVFYPCRAIAKRVTKSEEQVATQHFVEHGWPSTLPLTQRAMRCIQALGLQLHVGHHVCLVGDAESTDALVGVVARLLAITVEFVEPTQVAARLAGSTATAGIICVKGAAEMPKQAVQALVGYCREVATGPRPLVVVQVHALELSQPFAPHMSTLSAQLQVGNAFESAVVQAVPDADSHLTQVLTRHFDGAPNRLGTVKWHAVKSSESFAYWHKEIHQRQVQLRFTQQILLDLQRKPKISSAEAGYAPDGSELGLRAFEGNIEFDNYPEGAMRLLCKISEANGKFSDLQHCSIWYAGPSMDVFQPPAIVGGQCRGRVDGNKFVFQTGSLDFQVVVDVTPENELQMCGSVVDPSASGAVVGQVYLREVIRDSALSRKWVRYGDSGAPVVEETVPAVLPTPEAAMMSAEDLDRQFTNTQNVLKRLITIQDAALRDAVQSERDRSRRIFSASMLPMVVKLPYEARNELAASALATAAEISGRKFPSLVSLEALAELLGFTDIQLAEWLFHQRSNGLPYGHLAAVNGGVIRARLERRSCITQPVLVVDPWVTMTTWLKSLHDDSTCVVVDAASLLNGTSAVSDKDSVIVLGVSAANHREVARLVSTCRTVIMSTHEANVSLWSSEYHVINATITRQALQDQLQAQHMTFVVDSTQNRAVKTGLAKASNAEAAARRTFDALSHFVNDRIRAAAQDRLEPYTAFADVSVATNVMDAEKAKAELAETRGFVVTSAAAQKELDELEPVAKRLACLITTVHTAMSNVNPNYTSLYTTRFNKGLEVMRSGVRSVEMATRNFLEGFTYSLLEDDRLPFIASTSLIVAADRGLIELRDLRALLRAMRAPDVQGQVAFETRLEDDQARARIELEQRERLAAEATAATTKPSAKPSVRIAPAEAKPKPAATVGPTGKAILANPRLDFLNDEAWVRVLDVHRTFPAFANLPATFHEGAEIPGQRAALNTGATREARWREWFSTAGLPGSINVPVPFFEKDPNVTAVAKALLLLAGRPDKVDGAMRILAADLIGVDATEGLRESVEDTAARIAAVDSATQTTLPIVLACPNGLPANQLRTLIGSACVKRKVAAALESDEQNKGKAKLGKAAASALAEDSAVLVHRSGSQPAQALIEAINAAASSGHWLLIDRCNDADANTIRDVLRCITTQRPTDAWRVVLAFDFGKPFGPLAAAISATACPRIGVAVTSGLREAMLAHYTSVITEPVMDALGNSEWSQVLFLLSYIAAAVEQRCRYSDVGFVDAKAFRPGDTDLAGAATLLLRLLRASGHRGVPWDELREAVCTIVGSSLTDDHGKDVARAYVDWIIHPDVVKATRQATVSVTLGGLTVPADASFKAQAAAIEALASGSEYPEHLGLHGLAEAKITHQLRERQRMLLELTAGSPTKEEVEAAVARFRARLEPPLEAITTIQARVDADTSPRHVETVYALEVLRLNRIKAEALQHVANLDRDDAALLCMGRLPLRWTDSLGAADSDAWCDAVAAASANLQAWASRTRQGQPLVLNMASMEKVNAAIAAFVLDQMAANDGQALVPQLELVPSSAVTEAPATCLFLSTANLEGAGLDANLSLVDSVDSVLGGSTPPAVRVTAVPLPDVVEKPSTTVEPEDEFTTLTSTSSHRNVFLARSRPMSATRAVTPPVRPLNRLTTAGRSRPSLPLSQSPASTATYDAMIPLFRTPHRSPETFVGHVRMASLYEPNHWVLRGAALLPGASFDGETRRV